MYGHNGNSRSCAFSKLGDFFATGGADGNLLVWKSAFGAGKGESVRDKGLCQSGHRTDLRTVPVIQECMRKQTRVTATNF